MRRMRRCVCGVGLVALGLVLAAGCRSAPRQQAWSSCAGGEAVPQLSAPQVADVQTALARTLEKGGEEERAVATYAEALKQDPNRVDALVRLAALYDRQGKFRDSEELYRRALAAQPNNAGLRCNRGYSLYLQQRWAEAEQSLGEAIRLQPDHRRAHTNLGLVLARVGRGDEALAAFRRAGCADADAHTNLAYGLMLAGDWPEARRHYEVALAADPTAQTAQKGLKSLTALLDRAGPGQKAFAAERGEGPAGQAADIVQASFSPPVKLTSPIPCSADVPPR